MTPPRIITGTERRQALLDFGLPETFLEVLAAAPLDTLTRRFVAGDGAVLAEIADLPGVVEALPDAVLAPIVHVSEADLWYHVLAREADRWVLCNWDAEAGLRPMALDAQAYLRTLLRRGYEDEVSPAELLAWARGVGIVDPEDAVTALLAAR